MPPCRKKATVERYKMVESRNLTGVTLHERLIGS
jgi:hypothetical protein